MAGEMLGAGPDLLLSFWTQPGCWRGPTEGTQLGPAGPAGGCHPRLGRICGGPGGEGAKE